MEVEVLLLAQSMGMQSGKVVEWIKQVGEPVEEGDALAEAEEEKSTFEVVSPCRGVLSAIVVDPGVEVPVQTVLARIRADGQG